MTPLDLLDVAPATLDDGELVRTSQELGELRRRVDAAIAAVGAEMKHRSRREHGTLGLAQSLGAITPERLLERTAGVGGGEAKVLVRVGELLTPDAPPWLAAVGTAVEAGDVSVAKADAIRAGLGSPTAEVAADDLADAAARLALLAPGLPVDRVAAEARAARDELDDAGVADRARRLRERRYLTLTRRADGMTRLDGLLDPESAAIVSAAYDAATSPRRGGPRFVDAEERAAADRVVADERSIGQIALDTFVDLVRVGSEADPGRLLGGARHAVRVLVTARDLAAGDGQGFLAGQPEPVAVSTVQRAVCDTGILPIEFSDDLEPLRLGRQRRLFSARQRSALEARDAGCRFPECDRPASWCESHHIVPWSKGGVTDTSDGVLLCRHHHLLVHDNGWRIERDAEHGFVAIPPPTRDPGRTPIPMPTRSRVLARLRH